MGLSQRQSHKGGRNSIPWPTRLGRTEQPGKATKQRLQVGSRGTHTDGEGLHFFLTLYFEGDAWNRHGWETHGETGKGSHYLEFYFGSALFIPELPGPFLWVPTRRCLTQTCSKFLGLSSPWFGPIWIDRATSVRGSVTLPILLANYYLSFLLSLYTIPLLKFFNRYQDKGCFVSMHTDGYTSLQHGSLGFLGFSLGLHTSSIMKEHRYAKVSVVISNKYIKVKKKCIKES